MKGKDIRTMKQDTKIRRVAARLMAAALSVLLLFSLSGCSFFGPKEERTEWIVDGEYDPLGEEQTAAKLMGYIQAGDVDSIYQAFSQTAKDNSNNLREKIEELVEFINGNMVSWEFDMGEPYQKTMQYGKIMKNRIICYYLQTEDMRYACMIRDVMQDDFNTQNVGFHSIVLCPDGLESYWNRMSDFDSGGPGIYIAYQGTTCDESTMENLLELTNEKNRDGLYDLFSVYAKENAPDLHRQIETLMTFLEKPFGSWEFYDCTTEWVYLPGTDDRLLRRTNMFLIHTDNENYTLEIRDLLNESEDGENLGIYSIAVHSEQYSGDYRNLGWLTPGIFVYQLSITPGTTQMEGGGTVRFTTSIEAVVTCTTIKDIELKQLDAFTWEAILPPDNPSICKFTATAGDEEVWCFVDNEK